MLICTVVKTNSPLSPSLLYNDDDNNNNNNLMLEEIWLICWTEVATILEDRSMRRQIVPTEI